jgi:peptide/nickel transport system substrate-binding protein
VRPTCTVLLPAVRTADPHLCSDSHALLTVRRLLFQGLVAYDGRSLRGVLAESWEVEDEGRRWVFHLRRGARFHNGKECDSGDVLYSLKRAASREVPGELLSVTLHEYIGGADFEAPDPSTVVLRNPEPIADLGELLPDLAILPAGWRSYADGTGTGAYRLEEFAEGRAVLRRREGAGFRAGAPESLEFRAESDAFTRAAELRAGRADLALDPPREELERVGDGGEVEAVGWDTALCVVFFIDCRTAPTTDPRVRRALNLAVDKQRLIAEVLGGQAKPLNGVFSDRHFGWDPRVAPYPHDPEAARSLIQEAGLVDGAPLVINAPTSLPEEAPALADFLRDSYREVGFNARVVLHEDRVEYARKVAAKELSGLSCFDSSPLSTFKVLREKLDSRFAGTWWQGFHHDGVNGLLTRAAATINTASRRQLYWHVYRILHDEAPWVYLYQPIRCWLRRREFAQSLRIDDLGFLVL